MNRRPILDERPRTAEKASVNNAHAVTF